MLPCARRQEECDVEAAILGWGVPLMPKKSLPVEFMFRLDAKVLPPVPVSAGPQGNRLIVGVASGRCDGPAFSGEIVPGQGSEWATTRANGSVKADVRLLLLSDDGAHVLMTYNGIGTTDERGLCVRTAPLFETGDARYDWLNDVQAIGIGTPNATGIAYDVYRLL
jgi:hypothetical protein